jgi:hypothetical protein
MKILLAQNFEPPAFHLHLAMRTRNLNRVVIAFLELKRRFDYSSVQLLRRTLPFLPPTSPLTVT